MRQYGYHSYRGPAYLGVGLDPDGYGIGLELEVNVDRGMFNEAAGVRGVRAELDSSLGYEGVEFVFAASDDLGKIFRQFTAVRDRCGIRDGGRNYGMHINVNAQNKSEVWRALMLASGNTGNAPFLRQIARREGYSPYLSLDSGIGYPHHMLVDRMYGARRGMESSRIAIAMRTNRVEFRLFKGCTDPRVALASILFTRAWCRWIDSLVAQALGVSPRCGPRVEEAVSYPKFCAWLHANAITDEDQCVLSLVNTCVLRLGANAPYMEEAHYIAACGDRFNEVCNRLSTPQRQRRRSSTASPLVASSEGVPA